MPVQWMLVAHNGGARLYSREGLGHWTVTERFEHEEGRVHASDLVSDRAGRAFEGPGGRRTTYGTSENPREQELERFAHTLVGVLDDGAAANRYATLIIAAPPRLLGRLRAGLGTEAGRRLVASFDHDYARLDDDDALGAVLALHREAGL